MPNWEDPSMRDYKNYLEELIRQKAMIFPEPSSGLYPAGVSTSTPEWIWGQETGSGVYSPPRSYEEELRKSLDRAGGTIRELESTLERIRKEAGILTTITSMSKDKKHTFVKKGDQEFRIEALPGLECGHEVILHPKTMQIIETLGYPPLEASRFALDTLPNVAWEDIGGLEDAKKQFLEAVEIPYKNRELYAFYKKRHIKGILLSGPPGCGKTMLGKAAAYELAQLHGKESSRTGFLYVKGPEILNCYVGNTEETIRSLFSDAQRHYEVHGYPAIIFLDEADAILAARGPHTLGLTNTIVPAFLTEMDGLIESSALVVIATNRPDILDPAIIRDGRVDRKITIGRPDERQARIILNKELRKVPTLESLEDCFIEHLWAANLENGVWLRDVINGAMLVNCVQFAISSALHRDIANGKPSGLTQEDAVFAVEAIRKQSMGVRHDL